MRALPGTSRTPARAGRTDRTAAWRVAAVAVLLALAAAGLRSRGTFSHAPDRVLAGASGTALASGGAVPPRLPATAHGSPWPLIAGMLIALALLVALTAWSRHARRSPAR